MNFPLPFSFRFAVAGFLALVLVRLSGAQTAPAGMVRIKSAGKSFTIGMNPSGAKNDVSDMYSGEPALGWAFYVGQHKVSFTYDYYMDENLVTQGDFIALMKVPNPASNQTGGNLKLPVERVSWFEAVLYCNLRSKKEGLDTAYSYKGTSAANMTNVVVDIRKNGYRIPTNGEFEYALTAETTGLYHFAASRTGVDALGDPYCVWSGNSGGKTQPVGSRKPNPWGLYDMVGNLFEYTNDWDSTYTSKDQVDPLGPVSGQEGRKITRGGSYRNDIRNHMRTHYHYKWAPTSKHIEVGFRTARTALGSATRLGRNDPAKAPLPQGRYYVPAKGVLGLTPGTAFDIGGRLTRGTDRKILIVPLAP